MLLKMSFEMQRRLRRLSVRNLMNYIVGGMALCYVLAMFVPGVYSLLSLSRAAVFRGQIWRLVTFVFLPSGGSMIGVLLSLYFYWMIGSTLESQWGTFKFNLFYFVGVLGSILAALITGYSDNTYLNLSLFLAFASLFPDYQVLLFFFLPIKMKYLALLDVVLYAWLFITGGWSARVTILLCLANVFLFVGGDFINTARREMGYWKTRYNFRKAMRK